MYVVKSLSRLNPHESPVSNSTIPMYRSLKALHVHFRRIIASVQKLFDSAFKGLGPLCTRAPHLSHIVLMTLQIMHIGKFAQYGVIDKVHIVNYRFRCQLRHSTWTLDDYKLTLSFRRVSSVDMFSPCVWAVLDELGHWTRILTALVSHLPFKSLKQQGSSSCTHFRNSSRRQITNLQIPRTNVEYQARQRSAAHIL